ncbi:hypothetical protein PoMZ_11772 [Pyricularia oryzae]|uniref:Alcohol dehydrogenase-like C-terminal domain-containing protein n=1 Tax=Pyricularia oryzae TaxID=318829 RepID=A0A4P7NL79_PYROR|nr:hypothetical protein PoMZ_11772 [Pyricularia oryzae]
MIEERCDHLLTMSKGAVATGIKRIYDSCEEIFTGSKDTLDTLVQGGVLTRIYDAVGFGKGDFFKLDGSLTLSVATEFRRCRVETTYESVLIHSATGGPGQAAIQICQSVGAEIFATNS